MVHTHAEVRTVTADQKQARHTHEKDHTLTHSLPPCRWTILAKHVACESDELNGHQSHVCVHWQAIRMSVRVPSTLSRRVCHIIALFLLFQLPLSIVHVGDNLLLVTSVVQVAER